MTTLALFAPRSGERRKPGRPPIAANPNHIVRRVEAKVAVARGQLVKQVAADLGVSRRTILRWRTGQYKSLSASA